jgi:hypothetical protein
LLLHLTFCSFEFDQEMNCDSLTNALKISHVGPPGTTTAPSVRGTPACAKITGDPVPELDAAPISAWSWTATIENASDGIYDFILGNVSTYPAGATSGVSGLFILRFDVRTNWLPLLMLSVAPSLSSTLISWSERVCPITLSSGPRRPTTTTASSLDRTTPGRCQSLIPRPKSSLTLLALDAHPDLVSLIPPLSAHQNSCRRRIRPFPVHRNVRSQLDGLASLRGGDQVRQQGL